MSTSPRTEVACSGDSEAKPTVAHRIALLVAVVALSGLGQLVGDEYPLSHWPMYSAPGNERTTVAVMIGGRPAPLEELTGWSTARAQKLLTTSAARGEDAPAVLLRQLDDAARERGHDPAPPFELWWLTLTWVDGPEGSTIHQTLVPLRGAP